MKNYIMSIVLSGIVCAIAGSMLDKKTATGKLTNILTGILMCVTLLTPLTKISFQNITNYFNDLSWEAETYSKDGKNTAQAKIYTIIKTQTEAYILDKAKSMGLDVAVEVELDDNDSVPCGVMITGEVSPYVKRVLETYLEETLGIAKENQRWT